VTQTVTLCVTPKPRARRCCVVDGLELVAATSRIILGRESLLRVTLLTAPAAISGARLSRTQAEAGGNFKNRRARTGPSTAPPHGPPWRDTWPRARPMSQMSQMSLRPHPHADASFAHFTGTNAARTPKML
jgi:hypothetical protein